jgi:hypothetical protein
LRPKKVLYILGPGFYKKPKGLKKPYNPILGETFRCFWEHPNGSKTFYIAEQVSKLDRLVISNIFTIFESNEELIPKR